LVFLKKDYTGLQNEHSLENMRRFYNRRRIVKGFAVRMDSPYGENDFLLHIVFNYNKKLYFLLSS